MIRLERFGSGSKVLSEHRIQNERGNDADLKDSSTAQIDLINTETRVYFVVYEKETYSIYKMEKLLIDSEDDKAIMKAFPDF